MAPLGIKDSGCTAASSFWSSISNPCFAEMSDSAVKLLLHSRFLACSRIKLWWMTPEWGQRDTDVPPETQFMLLQLSPRGPYAVLLPLIDQGQFRATLRPPR